MMKLFLQRSIPECEAEPVQSNNTQTINKERVVIIGAGMAGITTAYYLAKSGRFDITVIDKDLRVRGASEQNASTIMMIPYPVFNTWNIWGVLKQSLWNRK